MHKHKENDNSVEPDKTALEEIVKQLNKGTNHVPVPYYFPIQPQPCPSCGRCPTCGQGAWIPLQTWC